MKTNLNQFSKNLIPRLIIFIAIVVNIFLLYFIYKNVLEVFSYSKEALLLKEGIVVNQLKADLFEKVIERLKNKKNIKEEVGLENFKDPFGSSEKIEVK